MILLQHWHGQGAAFEDLRGRVHTLGLADLLERAEEGHDRLSGQNLPGFVERLAAARIVAVEDEADGWRFILDDGQGLSISREAIADICEPPLWSVPRASWTGEEAAQLPVHDHGAVMAEDEALRACLLAVARHGFALLKGGPAREGEVEWLIARFGPLRETNYGRVFDVRVKPDAANLADTMLPLPPHLDNPYRITPPDLQLLHCLATAGEGGDTVLVDGLAVVERLQDTAPEHVALLARVPVQFLWSDGETRLQASAPVIEFDAGGEFVRLRCNERSRNAILDPDANVRSAWRAAFSRLLASIDAPDLAFSFRLAPGDMLLFDNRRILHGRTGFAVSSAERHLQGAYADADGLCSTLFRLTETRATAEVAALGALFESEAMADPYGEEMSIRDHMLQSAELAVARRFGAEMVIAALLHDIGWALGDGVPGAGHERLGADRVAPLLGPEIAEPIRHHVAAKRYLVGTRPDYMDLLSEASRDTLTKQGGPMNAAECAAFATEPAFDAALRLRALDDAGKDLRAPTTGFSSYAPLLRRQMIRRMLAQAERIKI